MNTDQQILAEKIHRIIRKDTTCKRFEPDICDKCATDKERTDQLLELVMAEKEKTIEEVEEHWNKVLDSTAEIASMGYGKPLIDFKLWLEDLKQPQTSSPADSGVNPSESCDCHCHHTAQNFSEPGYLNQPNWAECPLNCSSSCQHCQPREGREGKK